MNLNELLQHADWLRGLSRSLVQDGNEAEDVFQESMQAALVRLGEGGSGGDAARQVNRPWLAGVARMVARARRRRVAVGGRRAAVAVRESSRAAASRSPVDDLDLLEQQRGLIEHIGTLPATQRRAILARFYEGLPPRAIAAQTGASVATVKSQIQRGLSVLRERLDAEYGDRRGWALAFLPLAKSGELHAVHGGWAAATAVATWFKVAVAAALVLSLGLLWRARSGEPAEATPGPVASVAALGERQADRPLVLEPDDAPGGRRAVSTQVIASARAQDSVRATKETGAREVIAVSALVPAASAGEVGDLIVRCVQEGSSLPAPDVYVNLRARSDQPDGSYSRGKRSGVDGVARWTGIPVGPYFAKTQAVEVAAGAATEVVIELPWSAQIRGRVVDWAGQPVMGATVSELTGVRDTTDATGHFVLHAVPHTAWVSARAAGYQHSDVAVVAASERNDADVLLTMRAGGASLSGYVLSPSGAAIAGIAVRAKETVRYKDEHGRDYNLSSSSCRTDSTGRYELRGLLPVPHQLTVRENPFGSFRGTVDIERDGSLQYEIVLPEPVGLFGKVTDAAGRPVAGASVAAYSNPQGRVISTETDEAGDYRLPFVSNDLAQVRVEHLEAGRATVNEGLPSTGTQELDLALPNEVGDTSKVFRGQVVDAAGLPLEGWTVTASSPEGVANIGYTDADGRFEASREGWWMKDLSVLSPKVYGRVVQSYPDLAQADSPVVLAVTTAMGTIRGTVEDRSGGLPDDASVQLHVLNGPYAQVAVSTQSPGFEWTELPPGEYQVRVQASGRAIRKIPVKLEPGQVLDLGTLISSAGGTLELRGLPARAPSYVLVADRPGVVSDPIELRPGRSTLRSLPEGPATVTLMTPGRASRSFGVVIEGGQTTVHTLDETPGYVHEVVVTVNGCPVAKTSNGATLVGYSVEDPTTGAVVATFLQVAMQDTMELTPLAAGAYRLRAFTHEGHRGSALIEVTEGGPGEPTALDLRLPGL